LKTSDFDYTLPPELVAQQPIEPRDQARLLVLSRQAPSPQHARFWQLPDLLRPGDLLVCNDSRVIPARLLARKEGTGGKVELLLLRRAGDALWEALLKPARRVRPGSRIQVGQVAGRVVGKGETGTWLLAFEGDPDLEAQGQIPLPPYIRSPLADPERYQTVYACVRGSVAAPTAGLHFTPRLIQALMERGVGFAFLTLHIGLDTFRPVTVEDPRQHPIHAEWGQLTLETAGQINQAKAQGRRVVAVGTSTVRLLETAANEGGGIEPFCGWTRLFILPGHRFKAVDALITNFHLPRTSLLMLVCAFAGRERVLSAYQEAIRGGYRFYSFGDAMLIV
jgi:S-adenosylmethionine:tRNA ribosyltransferase-isomerase